MGRHQRVGFSLVGTIMHFLLDVVLGLPGNYGPFDFRPTSSRLSVLKQRSAFTQLMLTLDLLS